MSDLVSQLVSVLEACRRWHQGDDWREGSLAQRAAWKGQLAAINDALSAARAVGWVAVPVEPTFDMLVAAHDAEHCGNHEPHFANAYRAMLAARPLPAPPAQRGEG